MGNYFEDERTKKYAYGCVVLVVGFIVAFIFLKAYTPAKYVPVDAMMVKTGSSGSGKNIYYYIYVQYTYNNVKYSKVKYDEYQLGWMQGKKMTVYIDPDNPTKIYSSRWLRDILFIICLWGVISLLNKMSKIMKE